MSRKFCFLLLAMLLCLSTACVAYTDVDNHWAKKSIDSFEKIGLIQGYSDDTFRPDEYITRAELVTIVNRILKNEVYSTKYIADNNSKDWYYSEIRKAIASKIIQGDPNGNVRPNDYITREEAIVILHRAFSTEKTENMRVNNYSDSKEISTWAYEALSLFAKNGYIKGYEDNTIRPQNNITRAEVVTLIDRLLTEIVVKGEYTGEVHGNLLVNGTDVSITNALIDGDLIIAEGSNGQMNLKDIIVNGNVILRTALSVEPSSLKVIGDTYSIYSDEDDAKVYYNADYGISFVTPEKSRVVEVLSGNEKINYKAKNLIVIQFDYADDNIFKSFSTIEEDITERYANYYARVDYKKIGNAKCGCYYDKKDNVYLILIKRDEIVYTLFAYNIENANVIDNLLNSIELTMGTFVREHELKTYKNKKLVLQFDYADSIGVDDSYNTNVIFDGDVSFMLFIQVTSITDMDKFSIEELKIMFDSLASSEGDIIESSIKNVYKYQAIDYSIRDDNKLSRSLYIVAGNRLYKLIFTGDIDKIESIGNELFDDVINSIEM